MIATHWKLMPDRRRSFSQFATVVLYGRNLGDDKMQRTTSMPFLLAAVRGVMTLLIGIGIILPRCVHAQTDSSRPNVLFIAIDDLNDWVGCLDGHTQVRTPNIDRLARSGVNFTNAHCQAPICMPSRTSLLTGTYPHSNGVYVIEQRYTDAPLVKDLIPMPMYFKKHGYRTMGCGKIYHRQNDHVDEWDDWGFHKGWRWMSELAGPEGISGLPSPSIFDFGPLDVSEDEMADSEVVGWAADRLKKPYDKPFFLAIGFNTPHLPLFTPRAYYESYPLDEVSLPEVSAGDLDDMPPMGRKFTRYFDSTPMSHHNITRYGLWHKAVASYLACATFTDRCVGQLLESLRKSDYADNTVVVLWSDHGFHLGEKMHWEKRSLWDESTRVPFIISLPKATVTGDCARPVGLIDLYPTLVELCGLPPLSTLEGRSLVPLLRDPTSHWTAAVLTTHHPGNHAVRTERYRYIRYANGDQELYDHQNDPNEWSNLASRPESQPLIAELSRLLPSKCADYAPRLPRQTYTQEFDWSKP